MVLVLKTSERKFRGFESHPLRHFDQAPAVRKAHAEDGRDLEVWRSTQVAEEDGLLNR